MIDRIIIEDFKSLRRIDLSLGRLNLFIGTNASGKSNFLDALRVLQGIGNGFTISEILDGKPRSATSEVWEGIRGGSSNACFFGTNEVTITACGTLDGEPSQRWNYMITFSPAHGRVNRERFQVGDVAWTAPNLGTPMYERDRSVVWQLANPPGGFLVWGRTPFGQARFGSPHAEGAIKVTKLLANVQRVDPSLAMLKEYSSARLVRRLGEHGENFAALVGTICQNERTKGAYLSWLQELRPEEVDDVGTLSGAEGDSLFMVRENGREVSARALGEGTLRFAATTAAFFQPDMPEIMTIEEIETGIHPSRLRLLVELFRSQTNRGKTQVFATTHSPTALAWLQEAEYRTTFLCKRDEETGESTIRPLVDVPHFKEVSEKYATSDLFAEGWLEAALTSFNRSLSDTATGAGREEAVT